MNTPTHITIRMTPEFKFFAQGQAERAGMSLSAYIRTLIKLDYENQPTKAQNRAQENKSN